MLVTLYFKAIWDISGARHLIFRGVESSTISSINFSILGINKRFPTNYMTALGLNQAYTSLKLRNKYDIVLICSLRSMRGNILQL